MNAEIKKEILERMDAIVDEAVGDAKVNLPDFGDIVDTIESATRDLHGANKEVDEAFDSTKEDIMIQLEKILDSLPVVSKPSEELRASVTAAFQNVDRGLKELYRAMGQFRSHLIECNLINEEEV